MYSAGGTLPMRCVGVSGSTYIFVTAFRFQRTGYAQSLAFILLALVALLTLLLTLTLRNRANANEISG
jgi:ABC-type sugar transport system permease subunit